MTVTIPPSILVGFRIMRALCPKVFPMSCLLLLVWPLAAQQDPPEAAGTPSADVGAPSGYSGPAVLSRGDQPVANAVVADTIQPFLNVNRVYGTGLSGVVTGAAPNALQSGVDLGFGLRETHRWKRITLSVEYTGSYRDYTGPSAENGLNQFLTATAVSQLKRHLVLSIRQTGGILKQDIGDLLIQPEFLETSSTVPTNEPFSNGMKLIDSVATLTYQKTRRLSFSGTIEGSLVREDSTLIVGTNIGIVRADVNYRLSSRATIGLAYSFNHFSYTTFGSTDVENAGVEYSWRATKSVDLALEGGMAHSNTLGLVVVPIDPVLAALLGETTVIQVSDRAINTPTMNARVTKRWHGVSADLDYLRGISPGNGLVLASRQVALTAGLQYSGAKHWTVSIDAGRNTMAELGATTSYTGNTIGVSFSRLIRPSVQAVGRFGVLPVDYNGPQALNRTYYRAQIGLIFNPSQIPVALR